MKLIFDHSNSIFDTKIKLPLISCIAQRDTEDTDYMFENGWLPIYNSQCEELWYQTQSSRLKIAPISDRKLKKLKQFKISNTTSNKEIQTLFDIESYNCGKYEDFFIDDVFWGRVNFFDNNIVYSTTNLFKSSKSYGTLSVYYVLNKYLDKFKYLYIADYFEQFSYKQNFPGFEFWNGRIWGQ